MCGGRIITASAIRTRASLTMSSTKRLSTSASICRPTLLSVTDHCLRSRNYVNVIVAGKQPLPQWLDMDAAIRHCTAGLGIWKSASTDEGDEPDLVMACAGDVPTMETLAAVEILRNHFPALRIRVINVVDLMTLQSQSEHPHGISDDDFDVLFTRDKPIIFADHGYPSLIHKLTYRRAYHHNLHVHGFKEEGTTTTPFDMVVLDELDQFQLAKAVIDRDLVPASIAAVGFALAAYPVGSNAHGSCVQSIEDACFGRVYSMPSRSSLANKAFRVVLEARI